MVAERVVLRRVEHLEQRSRRVAPVVRTDLVDLVEEHDGVHRAGLADRADDPPGQRADVGAPVPADLGLVAHTTEGDAHERPTERPRDGLTERGLADAGRADEGEHRAGAATADDLQTALGPAGAHGEVFGDPLLDVLEPVVVGVEDRPRRRQVGRVVAGHAPRELEHGVEPGPQVARLRALVARALELADLAQRLLADLLRQVGGLDAGAVVIRPFGLVAELLADRGELLAQEVLPLGLVDAFAHVGGDLVAQLGLGDVLAQPRDELREPLAGVGGLEQVALLGGAQVARVAGEVGQGRRLVDTVDALDDLPGVATLQVGDEQRAVLARQRGRLLVGHGDLDRLDLHPERAALAAVALTEARARLSAHDDGGLARGCAAPLDDRRDDGVGRVAILEPRRDEQGVVGLGNGRVDRGLAVVVEFDRDDHAGQDDLVVDDE